MLADTCLSIPGIRELSWVDRRLEVRQSPIHGRGVFATAPILPGEVVIIWGGVLFTLDDVQAGRAALHSYAAIRCGVFLGHPVEQGNSPDDFVNHSCDPNIWMTDETTWATRREIAAGDEVTSDCAIYWGPDGDPWAAWECHCGSTLCRKVFTSDDWQRQDLHQRYGDHFAPYINERIRQLYR